MQYFQILVDFGFILSGTKKIVEIKSDVNELGKVTGDILLARIFLALFSFVILITLIFLVPILREFWFFTILSFIPIFLSVFLFDYLFRGIEHMTVVTTQFILMRGLSAFLTLILVKGDKDIIMIPILDILGLFFAIGFVYKSIKNMGLSISIRLDSIFETKKLILESADYFFSNMATTVFGALNTILIGSTLATKEVAYWSVCMQVILAIQTLYSPIIDGIYPEMVKTKDMLIIKKTLKIVMPVILLGCVFSYFLAPYGLVIVGGKKYIDASALFRTLIPVLFFSFPVLIMGWPSLGVIGKEKEVFKSTIFAALFQIICLIIIILSGNINIFLIAFLRVATEIILLSTRFYYLKMLGVNLLR